MKQAFALIITCVLFSCNGGTEPDNEGEVTNNNAVAEPVLIPAALMAEYPHDTGAFTEGLQVHDGKLYEGTGELKKSFIQITDITTGKVEAKHPIKDSSIFGEGINILNGKLYQLTYQNNLAYVYDLKDLSKPLKTFPWAGEGWGITNNGKELIISNGKASGDIFFVSPDDFKIVRKLSVVTNAGPVENINELEYINGFIYANIWGTTQIIKIDPNNGHVVGVIETANALQSFYSTYPIRDMDNVLNGIAYDSSTKKIYITGKRWPKLFEIRLN